MKRLKGLISLIVLSIAQAQNTATEVLRGLRQTVINTVDNLPKYVCTQTIDRYRYEPDRKWYARDGQRWQRSCDNLIAEFKGPNWRRRLTSSDRIRLDVAVDRSKPGWDSEMYSWAGEDHFSGRHLFEIVREGALQTGTFSSMLSSIFGESATFSYNGDTTLGGRLLSEFGFRVPLEKSHYTYVFKNRDMPGETVGYDGTILADPSTSRLVRLFVSATQLPEESLTCEITHAIDYIYVNLHGAEFLLPAEARVSFLQSDGIESENMVHYSNCHEFQGKSTISFDTTPQTTLSDPKKDTLHSFSLPSGIPFKLTFEQQLDISEAAAGDPIHARLTSAIRDKSSRILIPEGAEIRGRIVSVKHFGPSSPYGTVGRSTSAREPSWVIKVKLEAAELNGRLYALHARTNDGINRFRKVSGTLGRHLQIGRLGLDGDTEEAVFEFFGPNPTDVVTKGLESNWVTR